MFLNNRDHSSTENDLVRLPLNNTTDKERTLQTKKPDIQPSAQKQAENIAASVRVQTLEPVSEIHLSGNITPLTEKVSIDTTSAPGTGSNLHKTAVSSTESLHEGQQNFSLLPVSDLYKNTKNADVSGVKKTFTFLLNNQPLDQSWNITRNSSETPTLPDNNTEYISVAVSEQPVRAGAGSKQPEEPPEEISLHQGNSMEPAYIVKPGDMLGLISLKVYGASSYWPVIVSANKDQLAENPDGLQVGMELVIPALPETGTARFTETFSGSGPVVNKDGTYTVQPGDSLGIIAQKVFGKSWKWQQLYELNKDVLSAPHQLKVGQVLQIKTSKPTEKTDESFEPELEEQGPAILSFTFGTEPSEYSDSQ